MSPVTLLRNTKGFERIVAEVMVLRHGLSLFIYSLLSGVLEMLIVVTRG